MPYLEDGTQDPAQARRPDFSRARTQGSPVAGVASVVGRVAARLKADGDVSRIMLLLTAKAAREIVNAVDANTKTLKSEIGDVKEALKDLKGEVGDVKGVLKDLKGEVGSKTAALKRLEDLIPTRGKEGHSEHV